MAKFTDLSFSCFFVSLLVSKIPCFVEERDKDSHNIQVRYRISSRGFGNWMGYIYGIYDKGNIRLDW